MQKLGPHRVLEKPPQKLSFVVMETKTKRVKSGSKLSVNASSTSNVSGSLSNTSSINSVNVTPPPDNITLDCAMNGNATRFIQCFEDESDPSHDLVASQINMRNNEDGRAPLDWAAMLGNTAMLAELIARGADINAITEKGYTALHLAAAWGQMNCIKLLIESGASLDLKNVFNERPRDVAARYRIYQCIDYFDWAEARRSLQELLTSLKELFTPTEKLKILSKDDKLLVTSLLSEKFDWLDKLTPEVTPEAILEEKQCIESTMAPIINKLNEPLDSKHQKGPKKPK